MSAEGNAGPSKEEGRVLIVDDEKFLRDFSEQILSRFGYTVLTVADGERAVQLYRGKNEIISLVLLDLIMPGMGGRRCLETLLNIDPGVKVIVVNTGRLFPPIS